MNSKKESGFSLLSIMIVLMVLGIVTLGFKRVMSQQIMQLNYKKSSLQSKENLENIVYKNLEVARRSKEKGPSFPSEWNLYFNHDFYELVEVKRTYSDEVLLNIYGFIFNKIVVQEIPRRAVTAKVIEDTLNIVVKGESHNQVFSISCELVDCLNVVVSILGDIDNKGYLALVNGAFWLLGFTGEVYQINTDGTLEKSTIIASLLVGDEVRLLSSKNDRLDILIFRLKNNDQLLTTKKEVIPVVLENFREYVLIENSQEGILLIHKVGSEESLLAFDWRGKPRWGNQVFWKKENILSSCGYGEELFTPYEDWSIGCQSVNKQWVFYYE